MTNPVGRPTVATPENIKKAEAYLRNWEEAETTPSGVPTVEQLAWTLGISRESLYAREEFSDILERLKQIQAYLLVNNGLSGDYNSTIAKLILSSKHGYVEKTEQVGGERYIETLLAAYGLTPNEGSDARQTNEPVQGPSEGTPQP